MNEAVREHVRQRAGLRCEYCQLAEEYSPVARLQIEHIRPRKHGGDDSLENLALACIDCNLRKGPNLSGIDPNAGSVVELFNPRQQVWSDHFAWDGPQVLGVTAVGRATIAVLGLNSLDRVQLRLALAETPRKPR
ncbi:MAG: HNH endonuclease [Planctomycetales bacterium]|nr:HNH endonuclease [Planctomycetales bacterium]